MIKTFKQLTDIDNLIADLYEKKPSLKRTKFGYAYKRFAEKFFYPMDKEYQDELNHARINLALEDEKTKEILLDPSSPRRFKYTKEGLISVLKEENNIWLQWKDKEINIEAYNTAFIPEELTDGDMDLLKDIIINLDTTLKVE